MSTNKLPDAWVQRIFAAMQGNYGTRFLNMWRTGQILPDGNDAGVLNAMNHWAERLANYHANPDAIRYVLANLPPDPPTLPQFHELLRTAWKPAPPPRLEHNPTPEEIEATKRKAAENIAKLREALRGVR